MHWPIAPPSSAFAPLCVLIAAAATPPSLAAATELVFREVVATGDPVPGVEGQTFQWLNGVPGLSAGPARIDRSGRVTFSGGWTAQVAPHAVFKETAAGLVRIATTGEIAPGTGLPFHGLPSIFPAAPRIENGITSLDATIEGVPVEGGVWTDRSGELELVFRASQQPPGTPAGSTFFQWVHTMGGPGTILVNARFFVDGSSGLGDQGIFRDRTGTLETVALAGISAPGAEPGVVFGNGTSPSFLTFQNWSVDDSGRIAFNALVMGPGIDGENDEGVWKEGAGGLEVIAREGEHAPDMGHPNARFLGNSGFRTFGHDSNTGVHTNDLGHMLFGARVHVPAADNKANVIYTDRSGMLERVALGRFPGSDPPGEQAPGLPEGQVFTSFRFARINNQDRVAFEGFADAGDPLERRAGIWWDINGAVELVVAEGDPVPGEPQSAIGEPILLLHLLDSNRLVYSARIAGTSPGTGLFLVEPSGEAQLIARSGGDFLAGGAIQEIVPGFGASDEDAIAFELHFDDGRQALFTVRPVAAAGIEVASAPPAGLRLLPGHPNPFRTQTTLRYELDSAARVELAVFDVTGRMVQRLVDGRVASGPHTARWDGTDVWGRPVRSGIYFARIHTGSREQVQKLVVMR